MAETGRLHSNANQALDRINPEQVLLDLSLNLQAIVAQQLNFEVLINTPFVADLIAKGEVRQLKDAMAACRPLIRRF